MKTLKFALLGVGRIGKIHARNIYVVLINASNQLLVEGEFMDISELKNGAKLFINNNGVNSEMSELSSIILFGIISRINFLY